MTTSSLIAPVREPPQIILIMKYTFFMMGGNVGAYLLTCMWSCIRNSVSSLAAVFLLPALSVTKEGYTDYDASMM